MTTPELPKNLRLLVVDDLQSARNITSRFLKKLGLPPAKEAGSISEAMALVTTQTFDVIVTDVHLKEENAVDLIQKVRAVPGNDKIPFVVITSDMERSTFTEILKLGVSSYLLKPFSAQVLGERLTSALSQTKPT